MRNDRKVLSLILLIITLSTIVTALPSCDEGTPDEAETLSAFAELYERSLIINEYIYGSGMKSDAEWDGATSPKYADLSEDAPYKTRAELEAAVKSVYSDSYYESSIVYVLFDGYTDTEKLSPRYSEYNGVLRVDISNSGKELSGRFDTSKAEITKLSYNSATIRAPYTKGDSTKDYELTMVMTANGWRFDIVTY